MGPRAADPFACAELERNWIAVEHNAEYLEASRFRFEPNESQNDGETETPRVVPARGGKNHRSTVGERLLFD
jgi:hypothetical protein